METYSLSEARANLPLILNRVEAGEDVVITRHGRPAAVIVGHDRWMTTARLEVLEQARQRREQRQKLRGTPLSVLPLNTDYDVEAHIAWLREKDDPWDGISDKSPSD